MPQSEVIELLDKKIGEYSKARLAEICELSRVTLDKLLSRDHKVHDNTLIKVVEKLEGKKAKFDFVMKHKDHSNAFKVAASVLDYNTSSGDRKDVVEPSANDLLDPAFYQLFMHTGCDDGADKGSIESNFPNKSVVLNYLMESGMIVEENGRLYSKCTMPNELKFMLKLIVNVLNIKLASGTTTETTGPNLVVHGEERIDSEGIARLTAGFRDYMELFKDVAKTNKSIDGTLISMSTMFLSHDSSSDSSRGTT